MATLRKWFDDAGVDWGSLVLVIHTMEPRSFCPGWGTPQEAFRFDFTKPGALDVHPHPVLDHEFNSGYGAPEAPMFIAQDKDCMYFPQQYDGATALVYVFRDIEVYMDVENDTPYPGG